MATRERRIDTADRNVDRILQAEGAEIREARLAAGLSQAELGRLAGMSAAQVSRIERGRLRNVSMRALGRLMSIVGLEISVRAYPGGPAVRDRAQLALLERLHARLGPGFTWRTEMPMPIRGDQRAWDAAIRGDGVLIGVDAEARIRDIQAIERRMALKTRDSGVDHCLLLAADTHANRAVVGAHRAALEVAFPVTARAMLAALGAGRDPGGSGLVLL